MTPFELGLSAFWILLGISIPIIIVILFYRIITLLNEHRKYLQYKRLYGKFMNPDYWFYRRAEQAPNKNYIKLYFENSASKEEIELGIEKSEIRSFFVKINFLTRPDTCPIY